MMGESGTQTAALFGGDVSGNGRLLMIHLSQIILTNRGSGHVSGGSQTVISCKFFRIWDILIQLLSGMVLLGSRNSFIFWSVLK